MARTRFVALLQSKQTRVEESEMRIPKSRILVPMAVAVAAAGLLAMGLMDQGAALGQSTDVEVVEAPPAATPVVVTTPEARPPASPPEVEQPAVEPEPAQAQQLPSAGFGGLEEGLTIPVATVSLLATGWALTVLGAAMAVAGRFRYRHR
jgi:hypothetical protein